jgi:hypothetical protein
MDEFLSDIAKSENSLPEHSVRFTSFIPDISCHDAKSAELTHIKLEL